MTGPESGPGPDPSPLSCPPVIELRGIGRTYPGPPPVTALRSVDLVVQRGEYVAVTGPSGSGKSTLLHLLGLLDNPTSGTYLLDGVDVGRISEVGRCTLRGRRIGFVFQSFHLLPHRSAEENVQLAQLYNGTPRGGRRSAARRALLEVGLGHRLEAFPATMSGGERQRVAIARALVNEPSLLLCDEPTGNLDSANAEVVLELIEGLSGLGYTILVITHDEKVAARARRAVHLIDGKVTG